MRATALAAIVVLGIAQAADPAEIELVRDGKPQQLSDAARTHIAERLPQLLQTCSLNSRDHPHIFRSPDHAAKWQETQAKDHLVVRFAAPINVGHPHHPGISARELLLGLPDRRYPEPHLSRNGSTVTAQTKCSGGDTIKFVCAPELKPLMPASYHENCRLVE